MMPKLYTTLSMDVQQWSNKPHRLYGVGNSTTLHLQEPDQRCGRAAATHRGAVRRFRSASD